MEHWQPPKISKDEDPKEYLQRAIEDLADWAMSQSAQDIKDLCVDAADGAGKMGWAGVIDTLRLLAQLEIK